MVGVNVALGVRVGDGEGVRVGVIDAVGVSEGINVIVGVAVDGMENIMG
jgi:hypothetical protein